MDEPLGHDPNEGSTDPMVPEHWKLGEDFQDRIRDAGYDSETVEGIAVDIHDILQATDRIRQEIVPAAMNATGHEFASELKRLQLEVAHIRWHTQSAEGFLRKALSVLEPRNEQPF
jgi:hypothetical protein